MKATCLNSVHFVGQFVEHAAAVSAAQVLDHHAAVLEQLVGQRARGRGDACVAVVAGLQVEHFLGVDAQHLHARAHVLQQHRQHIGALQCLLALQRQRGLALHPLRGQRMLVDEHQHEVAVAAGWPPRCAARNAGPAPSRRGRARSTRAQAGLGQPAHQRLAFAGMAEEDFHRRLAQDAWPPGVTGVAACVSTQRASSLTLAPGPAAARRPHSCCPRPDSGIGSWRRAPVPSRCRCP